jgi:hypothetical protein
VEIGPTGHRHGTAVEDTLHAVDHALRVIDQDDDLVLYIGGDRTGRLLEVVVKNGPRGGRVIHSMPLRPKFYEYLR